MSLRPTNPKRITTSDLLPGDILMSVGPASNALDTLITTIDQGDYSHASLFVGVDGGTPMVVEATTGGVKYESISVDLDAQVLVDAYRFVSRDGQHRLGDPGWPVQPVIDAAMKFVNETYSYSRLFLAAVALLSANKSSDDATYNALVRLFEMYVGERFDVWLDQQMGTGKQMTCVQVATTAFWQASADQRYALWVDLERPASNAGAKAAAAASTSSSTDARATRDRLRQVVEHGLGQHMPPAKKPGPALAGALGILQFPAGSDALPAGFCSPRDLETSPSLTFAGCLQDTRPAR